MNEFDIKTIIIESFKEALEHTEKELLVPEVTDEIVLLESGLDSLGFATLVVMLEEKLGYDPFVLMEDPVYPKTFGEFVNIYATIKPKN